MAGALVIALAAIASLPGTRGRLAPGGSAAVHAQSGDRIERLLSLGGTTGPITVEGDGTVQKRDGPG